MPMKKPAEKTAKPPPSTKPLWQKLTVKPGETLRVIDLPKDLPRSLLESTDGAHSVEETLPSGALDATEVLLAFADSRAAVTALAKKLKPVLKGDARVWFAYPKGGAADFNRDTGWEPLDALGFTPVTQVAVSDRWSALRFRNKAHVGK